MKRTAKYYKDNPEARENKNEYNKKYNATRKRKKYRAALNKENRKRGTYGNGDGKDYDHAKGKMVSQSVNRGRNSKNGGLRGDKKARG